MMETRTLTPLRWFISVLFRLNCVISAIISAMYGRNYGFHARPGKFVVFLLDNRDFVTNI